MDQAGPDRTTDGVRMAILSSRMESIARKMQNTLFRTARSGVLNTAHDFSCVVLTADCRLLAAAESLPIHVMIGPDLMCQAVLRHHPELRRGDAFLHNSPYEGNSHAADHCLIVPVMDDDGIPRFFVLAKAHQADCGNSLPTTYMGHARDVYEEGALIFPAVKVQEDYRNIDDIIRICRMRIRVPEQWWGDYLAALGAVRIGERELLALGREVGWDGLAQYAEDWFDYSEQRMIEAIRRLPAGTVTACSVHDPFPGVPEGIPAKATVTVDAGRSEDHGRPARQPGLPALRPQPDRGLRQDRRGGRRLQRHHRSQCAAECGQLPSARGAGARELLLRHPEHPYSCSVATTNLADRVSNPVQRAIAEIADGFGMAETGPIIPAGVGVISGNDPRHGDAPFVNQIFLACTGGAGTPVSDGFLSIIHVGNAGLCHHDSIEVHELHHPLFVSARHLVPDTEGAGRLRGAPSGFAEFGPINGCTMDVLYTADGTINPALGARGGLAGSRANASKRELDGSLTQLPACHGVTLRPGERVLSYSAGGGGYGPPWERDPARVKHDLDEGWITRERAAKVYGVVLDPQGRIDRQATAARRAALAGEPRPA